MYWKWKLCIISNNNLGVTVHSHGSRELDTPAAHKKNDTQRVSGSHAICRRRRPSTERLVSPAVTPTVHTLPPKKLLIRSSCTSNITGCSSTQLLSISISVVFKMETACNCKGKAIKLLQKSHVFISPLTFSFNLFPAGSDGGGLVVLAPERRGRHIKPHQPAVLGASSDLSAALMLETSIKNCSLRRCGRQQTAIDTYTIAASAH